MTARKKSDDVATWGPGQFDEVALGGGATAGLSITKAGRLILAITTPDGARHEHDVTEGSALLGCGLHEAGARAAQIRERLKDKA